MKTIEQVGWIGIGAMGLPICTNLVRHGFVVTAIDREPQRVALAEQAGIRAGASIAAVVEGADVVVSMVFDDAALQSVVSGPGGVLQSVRAGSLLVDMSTVSPEASAAVAAALARAGIRYLRAPVSGSVGLAESAALTVFASGDEADFETCKPMFSAMSQAQNYVGTGEAARVVKLAINMMVATSTALIGEALRFGASHGLDRAMLVDALNASIVGSRHYQSRAASLKSRDYNGNGPMHLVSKDLDLALTMSQSQGLQLPLTRQVDVYVKQLVADGYDMTEVTAIADMPFDEGMPRPRPAAR